jgi:hypothetical protein
MGRATPIRKHTSHLCIGLTESEERRRRRAPRKAEPDTTPEETEQPAGEAAE